MARLGTFAPPVKTPSRRRLSYDMQHPDHPAVSAQIDKIRAEIQERGESRVGCEELVLLCPDEVSNAQKLNGIARNAEWEHWTFEYLPDGSVLFSNL